jgi:hypothetical protein
MLSKVVRLLSVFHVYSYQLQAPVSSLWGGSNGRIGSRPKIVYSSSKDSLVAEMLPLFTVNPIRRSLLGWRPFYHSGSAVLKHQQLSLS